MERIEVEQGDLVVIDVEIRMVSIHHYIRIPPGD